MILITGANGNLGKKLIAALSGRPVRAVVRSSRAEDDLTEFLRARGLQGVEIVKADYMDLDAMKAAMAGCDYAVHLVGVITERGGNTFQRVHVDTTRVLVDALAGGDVKRLCYLSLLGSSPDASNPCLSTRGQAEELFLAAQTPALVLRVPMVLGEDDYASRALRSKAMASRSIAFRASSLEQPIYAGDVVQAVVNDIDRVRTGLEARDQLLTLVGPESLTRAALTKRAAAVMGRETRVLSLPLWIGKAMAGATEALSKSPPITRAMLDVLDHDDREDPAPAARALGIELTPLDRMLELTVANG